MAKTTFKIEGLKDLEDTMRKLPMRTAKRITTKILKEAGQPIADSAMAKVPIATMTLYHNVGIGTRLTPKQSQRFKKQSPIEVHIGVSDPAGVQVEFGNEHQAAEPFMRPAWDRNKDQALDYIASQLWASINKAAKRAERKAAKAAKGK